jgi:hypothetical protein
MRVIALNQGKQFSVSMTREEAATLVSEMLNAAMIAPTVQLLAARLVEQGAAK